MNFKRLLNKYKVTFKKVVKTDGSYNQKTGKWVEGIETLIDAEGVILPLNNDDLRYEESGLYTHEDKKIITVEELSKGMDIIHDGKRYTVQPPKDYSFYAEGLRIYFAKRAGAIDD